jgi:hypothetical protein
MARIVRQMARTGKMAGDLECRNDLSRDCSAREMWTRISRINTDEKHSMALSVSSG